LCIGAAIYIYRIFVISRRKNIELDYLAAHDPLTNCLNRRGLFNIIDKKFAERQTNECYCIIMADIDRFKRVNDVYGHDAGDQVLINVAKIFKASIRKTDVAARYGGEEFCIALVNTSQQQALDIAQKMRKSVEESEFNGIQITCSFGITTIEDEEDTPSKLITRADKALYFSKTNGRNQVNAWDESMNG
jgi:diguanylate cyclase (GGDEF)-like protein